MGSRSLLVGRPPEVAAGGGRAPGFGAHPVVGYPPLASPPARHRPLWTNRRRPVRAQAVVAAAAPAAVRADRDRRQPHPGPAWAEMPTDRALLQIDRGRADVVLAGQPVTLNAGGQAYVRTSDAVSIGSRSNARLIFRGGSTTLLCAAARWVSVPS
jgi:putative peptide zinc metalloprotease protein